MSMVPPARSIRVGADAGKEEGTEHYSRAIFDTIYACLSPLALRRQIGQLLIAGFNGPQISPELRALAKEFGLGGVILFARNVVEPEQVAELAFEASRLVPDIPLWVSID